MLFIQAFLIVYCLRTVIIGMNKMNHKQRIVLFVFHKKGLSFADIITCLIHKKCP